MKQILLLCALLSAAGIQAQFVFSTFTDSYVNINEGISLTDEGWDDPDFTLPFGFAFTIDGQSFTQAEQTGLGSSIEFFSTPTSSLTGYISDLIDGQFLDASASTITYETSGAEGNRICKLQYFNCAFYNEVFGDEPSAESRVNFQIWFYEADNSIEYRFGANSIVPGSDVHEGTPGPSIIIATGIDFIDDTFEFGVALVGDPANPSISVIDFDSEIPPSLNGNPENGRVYRFAPGVVSTDQADVPTFSVYPTIVDQRLNITGDFALMSAYRILSIDGRIVQAGNLTSHVLDLGDLARGTYVLHLEGSPKAAKFIKD